MALVLAVASDSPKLNAADRWVATWATAQQFSRIARAPSGHAQQVSRIVPAAQQQTAKSSPEAPKRRFPVPTVLTNLDKQTIRMIVRTSIGGKRARIRLSNAAGGSAVNIGAAHIAMHANGSTVNTATDRQLTFSGRPGATLYAGQVLVSDPVDINLPPLSNVAVSLYVPDQTGQPTSHWFGLHDTYVSKEGDFTGQRELPSIKEVYQSYYWLAGVDVLASSSAATIVTLGDSITDGDQSTPKTNGMWPAILAERLQANKSTRRFAVVNAGISGNRLIGDNNSGLVRLYHDAINQPGVQWITLLEGINDITAATQPGATQAISADDLIAAYQQIINIAHSHRIRVAGCTLTPYGGSKPFNPSGETIRQAANHWIRTSGAFDAVIDFDKVTRDAKDKSRFSEVADSPDLLHPANAGYKLMADSIDLNIFRKKNKK